MRLALQSSHPEGICLNVNIPATEKLNGIRICQKAKGYWTEEFVRKTDASGRTFFQLAEYFENEEPDNRATDEWALANGYASVVPCEIDKTARMLLPQFEQWLRNG